jgi:hypothetical protein
MKQDKIPFNPVLNPVVSCVLLWQSILSLPHFFAKSNFSRLPLGK